MADVTCVPPLADVNQPTNVLPAHVGGGSVGGVEVLLGHHVGGACGRQAALGLEDAQHHRRGLAEHAVRTAGMQVAQVLQALLELVHRPGAVALLHEVEVVVVIAQGGHVFSQYVAADLLRGVPGIAEQHVQRHHPVAAGLGGLHQGAHLLGVLGGALEHVHVAGSQGLHQLLRGQRVAVVGVAGNAVVPQLPQVAVGTQVVFAVAAVEPEEVGLIAHAQYVLQLDGLLPDLLAHLFIGQAID
ncbi:MAG: hypothetical protein IJH50_05595, partial [Kiritimatiellae bacterium]|nr:hypothetical protein [Kiritimatiellia bacterium]